MPNLIDYKKYSQGIFWGDSGLAYDYILASTGLFVQAKNQHISARVPMSAVPIRGLDALPAGDVFYGLDFGYTDPVALVKCVVIGKALYCQELIYQSGLTNEDLTRRMASIIRSSAENVVVELHSHPDMPARFSPIDNLQGAMDYADRESLKEGEIG
jgi:hypothetical protein